MKKSDECLAFIIGSFLFALCFTILGTALSGWYSRLFLFGAIIPALCCLGFCWRLVGISIDTKKEGGRCLNLNV
jgi:hypothetical protein